MPLSKCFVSCHFSYRKHFLFIFAVKFLGIIRKCAFYTQILFFTLLIIAKNRSMRCQFELSRCQESVQIILENKFEANIHISCIAGGLFLLLIQSRKSLACQTLALTRCHDSDNLPYPHHIHPQPGFYLIGRTFLI